MQPDKILTAQPPSWIEFVNPVRMLAGLYDTRELIIQFARREVVGRYKGAYFGVAWSLISPLATLLVYTFVFGVILKARFGTTGSDGTLEFGLNLFCGLIVYDVFSSCVGRASGLITGNTNYVKKVVFPLEILPVSVLLASLVGAVMSLAVLLPALFVFSTKPSFTMLLFPVTLIPLCSLSLGIGWLLASIGVFLRDIGHMVSILLQLLFFLSPIVYPLSAAPDPLRIWLRLNPLTTILEDARGTLLGGRAPEWGWWLVVTVVSLFVMQFGYVWFMRSKRAFADVL